MKNRNIQLTSPTIDGNTYGGEFANKYIAAALLSGDTLAKGLITLHPNVKYKEVIRNYANSVSIDDATCDYVDSSTVTLSEYILTMTEKQVNLTLCKMQLHQTWEAMQMGFSAFDFLPPTFSDFVIAQTSAQVAQQVEQGIWNSSLWSVGGMTQYLLDNGSYDAGASGPTTASNVIDRLQSMLDNSPAALYGKEGYQFYVGPTTMKAYQAALSAGNYNFQFFVGEKPMDFQGIPVTLCPGIANSWAVLGLKSDLHFGTGLLNNYNEVKLIDMSDIDGSQNVRIIMRFTGGIIATNPEQQVVFYDND